MNQPLGLPEGSVRAIITILIVSAYLIISGLVIYAKIYHNSFIEIPDYFTGIFGIVIGYYFGSRTKEANNSAGSLDTTNLPQDPIKFVPQAPAETPLDNQQK